MAVVGPRDVPLNRATVMDWHTEYNGLQQKPALEDFLATKVAAEGLSDMLVDMQDLGQLSLVDILLQEWASYA